MTIHWDNAAILWHNIYSTAKDVLALSQHNAPFDSERKRINASSMLNHSKANIKTIAESSTHLDIQERNELYALLNNYECLFHGNLGKPYDIKLKPDAEPYHGKRFPVPRIHELTFKQELDRLEYLKVIKKVNCSQQGAPTFLIPKKRQHITFYL